MLKKVVITNGKFYIGENKTSKDGQREYCVTSKIEEAKLFNFYWLIASKRTWLKGIRNLFGNEYNFAKIGG
jgi:hypothetical protein